MELEGQQHLLPTSGHTALVGQRENRMKGAPPHLLMVPYPAQPHILPMLSLAKQLAGHGGLEITFVCHQTLIDRLLKNESSSSDAIHFVGVPDKLPGFNPPSELPLNPIVLRESLELGHCMGPFVDELLHAQENLQGPTCVITDRLHWWSTDISTKLGIPRYTLCVNSAAVLQILMRSPLDGYAFDEKDSVQHIPGLPPLQSHHIPMSCQRGNGKQMVYLSRWPKSILESDGVLVNTCLALESQVIDSLRDTLPRSVPVLAVGPLGLSPGFGSKGVSMEGLELADEKVVADWLGAQPPLSVLYVSFGTTGLFNLGKRHVTELARALEASGHRFLWVFRAPPGVDETDPDLLPAGFEHRVQGRALLVRGWAPQLQILAHPSTGAFLSSCGWNSAIESLALGVPVIAWPSFADQPIVARILEATLKVGVTLPFRKDHFVEKEEFVHSTNIVLQSKEGNAMRQRIAKIKTNIGAAIAPGGSSYEAIAQFANLIKSKMD